MGCAGREYLPHPVLLGAGSWCLSAAPKVTRDQLAAAAASRLPSAFLKLKFSQLVAEAFFVEIHSPWPSSRVHSNAYLLDLVFVWLAFYFVCFALCSSFPQNFHVEIPLTSFLFILLAGFIILLKVVCFKLSQSE